MAHLPGRYGGLPATATVLFLCLLLVLAASSAPSTGKPFKGSAAPTEAEASSASAAPAPVTGSQGAPAPTPAPGERPLGWGPQRKDQDAAAAAVAVMTTAQKAGQVLLPFYQGVDPSGQVGLIKELHLAGSIVMGDNVPRLTDGSVDSAAMARATSALGQAARADGRSWPALVGVDQEGGLVARLGAPLTEWPTALSYGAAGSPALASEAGKAMGSELAGLGFTVDFAPDADVTIGPQDPTIGSRSLSGDPDAASRLSASFGQGLLAGGLLPVSKHFPGHGSVTVDSHSDLPVQDAPLAELQARDWKPFRDVIRSGQPMVMMGHIALQALDPGVPASVSAANYAALRSLGFQGVAVTDALNMGAIRNKYPGESSAPLALAAGADLLLMPGDVRAAHQAIVAGVADGTLSTQRLDDAARRVITMMKWREREAQPAGRKAAGPGSGAAESRAVSSAAVTIVDGPCSGRLVPESVSVTGGSATDRDRFAAAARRAGIDVGHGPVVALAGYGSGPVTGDVVVSLDAPWPLGGSTARSKIALYGRTPGAFDALLAVLAGVARAPGKLPAAVGRYPAGTGCP